MGRGAGLMWSVLFSLPAIAFAAVTEPPIPPATTGESVPKPVPAGEVSLVTARGFTAMDITLQGLFTSRGENIDYVNDAQTTPGTFSPRCGFTVQFVLGGGACRLGLGWYNVTPGGNPTPPPQDQLYPLVPATFPTCPTPPMSIDPTMACCSDSDFCPLATYDTSQMPQHAWNMPPIAADSIRSDAHYAGGLIGFVLMGAGSGTRCSENKYSQLELNNPSPNGGGLGGRGDLPVDSRPRLVLPRLRGPADVPDHLARPEQRQRRRLQRLGFLHQGRLRPWR